MTLLPHLALLPTALLLWLLARLLGVVTKLLLGISLFKGD